jgi:sulfatase maturation enzyme AslB (radical SAM superfamily)
MQKMSEVRMLHMELSSRCNARCPMCTRNYHGFPYNAGYEETDMTIDLIKSKLSLDVLANLDEIWINGNYGDFVMNLESVDIISWLRENNSRCRIIISTNGSARDKKFWQDLGALDLEIWFCLDGLKDTHSLYRIDTNWDIILSNAKIFMDAGGCAVWSFTEFPHNQHQLDDIKNLAQDLGFNRVDHRINRRGSVPVFDRSGKKIYMLGEIINDRYPDTISTDWIDCNIRQPWKDQGVRKISCEAKNLNSVYIGATGSIAPCCYVDMIRPDLRGAGQLPVRDPYLQLLVQDAPETLDSQQDWFLTLQKSWEDQPHGVCQHWCGIKT